MIHSVQTLISLQKAIFVLLVDLFFPNKLHKNVLMLLDSLNLGMSKSLAILPIANFPDGRFFKVCISLTQTKLNREYSTVHSAAPQHKQISSIHKQMTQFFSINQPKRLKNHCWTCYWLEPVE